MPKKKTSPAKQALDKTSSPETQIPTEKTEPEKLFSAQKIYLKDVSFETPSSPDIFATPGLQQKIEVQVGVENRVLDGEKGITEIILKVTVTSKHEETTFYLAEVQQAGIFQIKHPDLGALEIAKEVSCPHFLLSFAREELNSLITKGGFPAFLLAPINFEAAFAAKKEKPASEEKSN